MLLRMSNSIPRSAEVFKYAANGDILGLQSLFDLGKASPFDVCSVKGQSALRYAVSKNQLDVCEFLLQKQADPFLEDRTNLCAFDIAWNKIFSGKASRDMQARLQALFLKTDRLEQRGFSKLHQGILGLRHVNLEEELRFSSRTAINQKDADGRTAVSWAAWRGDIDAVELFTKYGSDIKIPSKRQIAPIHYALESGSASVVQFLLNTGADPNHPSDEGLTPLHWLIATHDRPDLVQLLVEYGSALNCGDFTGTTPLMTAVQHNRPRSVRKLIEQGANLEEEDEEGWTALNLAIFMNRHECLKILLDAQANCEHITSDGSSILHFAAENADLKTMQSLVRRSSHLHFPIDSKRQEDGLTALELAEERTVTDEWQLMFLKLCQCT
ncbi:uncharacterized protein Aud_003794 [Aspergillus udagawae]|uniref:Uncharacterized protein n=1 Tax=Aspergillus udagawae TaxID=91492 RepID=A0A8E0QN55_9EURO|nr:uncharacterized protein Aud_003794 [Aspergillus udagawae]GIC87410.1 hypothetical protein Aud_003794 [Aspergillus udagawae]